MSIRVLRGSILVVLQAAMLGGIALWVVLLLNICSEPSIPDPESQHIISYNCHGHVVFITPMQQGILDWLVPAMFPIVILIQVLRKRWFRRPAPKDESNHWAENIGGNYQAAWSVLKRRETVALTAFVSILPISLLVGYFAQSGPGYFITFMVGTAIYVALRLRAMHTPCPRCNRPFSSGPAFVASPKRCVHCGLPRGVA